MMRGKVLVFVVGLLVLFSACGETAVNEGNTAGNIVNGGWIDEEDGWLYFAMGDDLYKSKEDGSEKEKLCDARATIEDINVVGDNIYFSSDGLYTIKTDGSDCQCILAKTLKGIYIENGWVYYGNEYRVKVGETEEEQIYESESVSGRTLNIVDGWMYFVELDSESRKYEAITRMRIDGSRIQEVYPESIRKMLVYGEWIYFIDKKSKSLCRMSTSGKRVQVLTEEEISWINIKDEWIYFHTYDGYLYKIKTNGKDKQVVFDTGMNGASMVNGQIIGDWIYFKYMEIDSDIYRMKLDGSEYYRFAEKERIR